ncbi:hypothetical protein BV22DRAFT_917245 [Leucogyrophana mollusca]|uniref:Uncharacterized protein n=1 Tax=Leucogyrophana mollusca TaxID=85980 RepID=A0ACB8AZW9_9AGAM|nr:hypothetical protein BV22DRAFT_917245 [Leucogyrophana mollusca]
MRTKQTARKRSVDSTTEENHIASGLDTPGRLIEPQSEDVHIDIDSPSSSILELPTTAHPLPADVKAKADSQVNSPPLALAQNASREGPHGVKSSEDGGGSLLDPLARPCLIPIPHPPRRR